MKKLFGYGVRAVVVGWLVVHFTLTLLYVSPLNPIKIPAMPLLNKTIGTYFPQNWSLFAPNPLTTDQSILVHCLSGQEMAAFLSRGLPEDGWYDLSMPFWHRYQQNRFSAYDRLIRPQSTAMRSFLSGGYWLQPWAESCRKGDQEACKLYEEALVGARATAAPLLAKIGSAFCQDIGAGNSTHVALRVRSRPALPWSQRDEATRKSVDSMLGVYEMNHGGATTGLYRAGGG
jgi:hypothetical protein